MVGNLHGHKVGIVTCANDTMRDFASIWLRALLSTGCKLPVYVIPFDGGTDYISKLCEHNGVHLLPNEEDRWVSLGREIYGEEEYRHGVKRSLYFSKLRAFDTPLDTIIYMDINAIPFENPEKLLPSFLSSGKDILFEFQVSGIGRNISSSMVQRELNDMNAAVGRGWGMQFFIARKDSVDFLLAREISEIPDLRASFGDAPEQSFLTRYIAEYRTPIGKMNLYHNSVGASCRDRIFEVDGRLCTVRKDANREVRLVKWNGSAVKSTLPNYWLLERFA